MKTQTSNTKTQHTPGPWYFETDGDGPRRYWDKYICADNGGGRVCTINDVPGVGMQEVFANAKLIAAAPDLLALAQTIHAWLVSPALDPYTIASVQRQAAEAIAKATGKEN